MIDIQPIILLCNISIKVSILGVGRVSTREGNAGRNSLRGPGFFEADWELAKNFKLTERQNLRFSWQNFNVLNNVNRGLPVNDQTSSSVETITSLEGFAILRTMQFSLKYSF